MNHRMPAYVAYALHRWLDGFDLKSTHTSTASIRVFSIQRPLFIFGSHEWKFIKYKTYSHLANFSLLGWKNMNSTLRSKITMLPKWPRCALSRIVETIWWKLEITGDIMRQKVFANAKVWIHAASIHMKGHPSIFSDS